VTKEKKRAATARALRRWMTRLVFVAEAATSTNMAPLAGLKMDQSFLWTRPRKTGRGQKATVPELRTGCNPGQIA
jgi:hypothetical protein